jgi:hypothetical protein
VEHKNEKFKALKFKALKNEKFTKKTESSKSHVAKNADLEIGKTSESGSQNWAHGRNTASRDAFRITTTL